MAANQRNGTINNGDAVSGTDAVDVRVIVSDFLRSQLSEKGFEWNLPNGTAPSLASRTSLTNSRRSKINNALCALSNEYLQLYEASFIEKCEMCNISPTTPVSTYSVVFDELFAEGIKWNHIITLMVFGSQLALTSVERGHPVLVGDIHELISSYISSHLLGWINDHGGWVGFLLFLIIFSYLTLPISIH